MPRSALSVSALASPNRQRRPPAAQGGPHCQQACDIMTPFAVSSHAREPLMADYDSPWKEALDLFFEAFLDLFFPQAHADIDWNWPYKSLDKELQQIAPDSDAGRRYVDKLFEVRLKSGVEQWILVHVEVQMDDDGEFPVRMFVYHYRIFDKYNRREVVSFAVLGDDNPVWRPQTYRYQRWGMEIGFRFPVVKLLDFVERRAELEASENPFAAVVLAHLDTQETWQRPGERKGRKFALVKRLLERGWDAKKVRQLYRLIDWLMELPSDLKTEFSEQLASYQKETQMPFIDTFEEIGMVRGYAKGIERILALRFPDAADQLMSDIRKIRNHEKLEDILVAAATVSSPDELRRLWANGSNA
jgi:hypothetical protein